MKARATAAFLAALLAAACHAILDPEELKGDDSLKCEGGGYDESTGLCWQHPRASGSYGWQEAIDYC